MQLLIDSLYMISLVATVGWLVVDAIISFFSSISTLFLTMHIFFILFFFFNSVFSNYMEYLDFANKKNTQNKNAPKQIV